MNPEPFNFDQALSQDPGLNYCASTRHCSAGLVAIAAELGYVNLRWSSMQAMTEEGEPLPKWHLSGEIADEGRDVVELLVLGSPSSQASFRADDPLFFLVSTTLTGNGGTCAAPSTLLTLVEAQAWAERWLNSVLTELEAKGWPFNLVPASPPD